MVSAYDSKQIIVNSCILSGYDWGLCKVLLTAAKTLKDAGVGVIVFKGPLKGPSLSPPLNTEGMC